jgi:hypothetical protein
MTPSDLIIVVDDDKDLIIVLVPLLMRNLMKLPVSYLSSDMYDTFFSKIKKSGELGAVSHHRSRFIRHVTCACHISTHGEVSHA